MSTAATEDGLKALKGKIIDQEEEYLQRKMTDDECNLVTAEANNIKEAISRMVSALRCGHDNFSVDMLKISFSFRKGADSIIAYFLDFFAKVTNSIF